MAQVAVPAFDAVYANREAALCNKALYRLNADVIKDDLEDTKNSRICKTEYAQTRDELLRTYPFAFATKNVYIPMDAAYAFPRGEYGQSYKTLDPRTMTGSVTAASAVITGVTGITLDGSMVGRKLAGTGIPADARIVAIDATVGAQTITLDRVATATGASVSLTMTLALLKILSLAGNEDTLFERVGSGSLDRILTNAISVVDTDLGNMVEMSYVEQIIDPDLFDSQFRDAFALRLASKIGITVTGNRALVAEIQAEFAAMFQLAQVSTAQEKQTDSPDEAWTSRSGQVPSNTRR